MTVPQNASGKHVHRWTAPYVSSEGVLVRSVCPDQWTAALLASDMDSTAKFVGLVAARYADWQTGGNVRPGNERVQAATSMTKKTVLGGMARLRAAGWLNRTSKGGGRSRQVADTHELTLPVQEADTGVAPTPVNDPWDGDTGVAPADTGVDDAAYGCSSYPLPSQETFSTTSKGLRGASNHSSTEGGPLAQTPPPIADASKDAPTVDVPADVKDPAGYALLASLPHAYKAALSKLRSRSTEHRVWTADTLPAGAQPVEWACPRCGGMTIKLGKKPRECATLSTAWDATDEQVAKHRALGPDPQPGDFLVVAIPPVDYAAKAARTVDRLCERYEVHLNGSRTAVVQAVTTALSEGADTAVVSEQFGRLVQRGQVRPDWLLANVREHS